MNDFIQAYQTARTIMDTLKQGAKRAGSTTVMHAMASGKSVVVTKGFKGDGEYHNPGEVFTPNPALLNKYEVLAGQGYFTTVEQYEISKQYQASKRISEQLEAVHRKWSEAANAKAAAESRVSYLEAELHRAKGESKDTARQLEKAEAEGMAVFADLNQRAKVH